MTKVKPIPEGYHTLTPSLVVSNTKKAIAFYEKAFGGKQVTLFEGPGGKVMHAEIRIGDSLVMLNDAMQEMGGPAAPTGDNPQLPFSLWMASENVDAAVERAVAAGCKVVMPVEDMFWGDRFGRVRDPFGYDWSIATHKEDLTPEEMQKRQDEFMASMGAGKK